MVFLAFPLQLDAGKKSSQFWLDWTSTTKSCLGKGLRDVRAY